MENAKILIVEDEKIVAKDIENCLKRFGYTVAAVASSGPEAIEKAAATRPDLVLMDILLKGEMDGVRAAEQIRTLFNIPIVYLTAYADDRTLQRAKTTEPYGYIIKPFEERELHFTVEIALYKHKMEKRIWESEKKYKDLFNSSIEGIYQTDADGIFTLANPAMARIFGYNSPEELIGRRSTDYWFDLKEREAYINELRSKKSVSAYLIHGRKSNGEVAYVEISSRILEDGRGNFLGIGGILRDVTERRRMEQKLQGNVRQQAAIAELSQRALQGVEISALMDEVVNLVAELLKVEYCKILELLPDGNEFLLRAGVGWKEGLVGRATVSAKPDSQAGYTLFSSGPVIVDDFGREERFGAPPLLREHGVVSGVSVIIMGKERPWGVLGVHTNRQRTFAHEDVYFLGSVASLLVSTIERKGMEEMMLLSKQDWEDTFDTITDMITVHDKDFNIIRANKAAEKILGLSLLEPVGDTKCFKYYHGACSPPEGCPSCDCLKTGIAANFELFEPHLNMFIEIRAIPRFDSENRLAGLIHVARDITQRKQHESEIQAIVTVSSALRAARTRSEMLPVVLDQVMKLLKGEGAALAMRSFDGSTYVELALGDWASWTGMHLSPGKGVSGHVIESGRPYLNNDVLDDPAFARPDLIGDLRAVACVPLIAHEQVIGALWVGRRSDISEDDLRVLTAIGDIAANAIRRITLHEQTVERMERIAALRTIDIAISGSLDLRVTLNVLLEQVVNQLHVDAADVQLLNPLTRTLEHTAGRGFRTTNIHRTRLRVGECVSGRAALERKIVSVVDLSESGDIFTRSSLVTGEDFVSVYCVPLMSKGHVKGVLEIFHRSRLVPDPDWMEFLEALAVQAAIAIDNAALFNNLERSNVELMMAYDTTLEGWSRALDLRDKETEGHTQRVADMTLRIASEIGIGADEFVHLRRGALLHDIGKMGIPDRVLLKPGPLTDEEWVIMRRHPVYAHELLSPIAYLRPALDIPYCHHERWDGTGYPRGLKGKEIPLSARIFAIVDVWDALRSDRPYRPAWSEDMVREHIRSLSGTHFDPDVVEAFLRVLESGEKL